MKRHGNMIKRILVLILEKLSNIVKQAFFIADMVVVLHSIGYSCFLFLGLDSNFLVLFKGLDFCCDEGGVVDEIEAAEFTVFSMF